MHLQAAPCTEGEAAAQWHFSCPGTRAGTGSSFSSPLQAHPCVGGHTTSHPTRPHPTTSCLSIPTHSCCSHILRGVREDSGSFASPRVKEAAQGKVEWWPSAIQPPLGLFLWSPMHEASPSPCVLPGYGEAKAQAPPDLLLPVDGATPAAITPPGRSLMPHSMRTMGLGAATTTHPRIHPILQAPQLSLDSPKSSRREQRLQECWPEDISGCQPQQRNCSGRSSWAGHHASSSGSQSAGSASMSELSPQQEGKLGTS